MAAKDILQYCDIAIVLGCIAVLSLITRKKMVSLYGSFVALLCLRITFTAISICLLFHRELIGLARHQAYVAYFYTYWADNVLEIGLELAVIYRIYSMVMEPMQGLQRIGTVIFRWIAAVSIALSTIVALGPHAKGWLLLATLFGQVQEGVSVLMVCLLAFVCFAARPLGLTFRSRAFGIALGLGAAASTELVLSAWAANSSTHSLYSPVFVIGAFVSAFSLCIWTVYFALPEPERKMVLLPTTSPYFHWNSISEALGDDPGMVAVAGFTPAMLSQAELVAFAAVKPADPAQADAPRIGRTETVHALAASF